MKRRVLLIVALAILVWAVSAACLVLPQVRKSHGDPDEFQARQVLDEGITVPKSSTDTVGRNCEGQPPANPCRAQCAKRNRVNADHQRLRVSITFSGGIIFLER